LDFRPETFTDEISDGHRYGADIEEINQHRDRKEGEFLASVGVCQAEVEIRFTSNNVLAG
jgi:hypothetical protein